MTKGVNGRCSSARTERPLKGDISHIRVIGREERTNAEQAQYRFLLLSLTTARLTPPFVNIIWFPGNAQGIKHDDEEIDISCHQTYHILNNLNDSQRAIVRAMVSTAPRDLLVIAHGMCTLLQLSLTHANTDVIAQGLLEQGKQPQSQQQHRYGYPTNGHAG